MDRDPTPFWTAILLPVLLMLGATVICAITGTIIVDTNCVNTGNTFHVRYPTAALVSQEYSFVRPNGAGTTTTRTQSPDHPLLLTGWYAAATGSFPDQYIVKDVATLIYDVEPLPAGGTAIYQETRCLQ